MQPPDSHPSDYPREPHTHASTNPTANLFPRKLDPRSALCVGAAGVLFSSAIALTRRFGSPRWAREAREFGPMRQLGAQCLCLGLLGHRDLRKACSVERMRDSDGRVE